MDKSYRLNFQLKRTLTIPTEQIALINNTKNYDVKFDDSELKVKISFCIKDQDCL